MIAQTYFEEGQLLEFQRRTGNEDRGVRFWIGGDWEATGSIPGSRTPIFFLSSVTPW